MAPRKRSDRRRDFPDNTYESGGYYRWRHPVTRREYGLGSDRTKAFKEARRANLHLAMEHPTPSLVDRITGKSDTWQDWIDQYGKILAKRGLAPKTMRTYKSLLGRAGRLVPDGSPFKAVTTRVIAQAITSMEDEGKARTAQQFRGFLKDMFNSAIAEGLAEDNPAIVTRKISVEVKRARLTFEVFQQLYDREQAVWAKNAYALALVSAQPRECIGGKTGAQFTDIRDGKWWNRRGKTGAMISIPLSIRLDCFGMSLADVVKQCRTTGVLSRYLVHHMQGYGKDRPVGGPVRIDTISNRFAETIAALGIDWGDKEPPTFHEIRSLSERLYSAQGNVNTQDLLGHKRPSTTALYHDSRGAEWIMVNVK